MTPHELSDKIERVITQAEASFGKQVIKTQEALFSQIQLLLNRLELSPDGTIKQSQANRALLSRTNIYFEKAFKESGYYQSLNQFPGEITYIGDATKAYFTFIKDLFSPDAQYLKSLEKQAIKQLESLLANEGLELAVKKPILDILNQNINTSARYSDLVKQVREFVIGDDKLQGKLRSYSGQIVTDTLFNFARGMQEAISSKTGLQYVVYSGGIMDDSREFCIERAGQYFHKDEVSAWAPLEWQGKRRGTTESTIFIYAGGYRCLHQIIYVSDLVVPKKVRERQLAKNGLG